MLCCGTRRREAVEKSEGAEINPSLISKLFLDKNRTGWRRHYQQISLLFHCSRHSPEAQKARVLHEHGLSKDEERRVPTSLCCRGFPRLSSCCPQPHASCSHPAQGSTTRCYRLRPRGYVATLTQKDVCREQLSGADLLVPVWRQIA